MLVLVALHTRMPNSVCTVVQSKVINIPWAAEN